VVGVAMMFMVSWSVGGVCGNQSFGTRDEREGFIAANSLGWSSFSRWWFVDGAGVSVLHSDE